MFGLGFYADPQENRKEEKLERESAIGYFTLDGNGKDFAEKILEKLQKDIAFKEETMKQFENNFGKNLTRKEIMDSIKSIKEYIIEIEDSHNFMLIVGTKLALLCFEEMLRKMNNEKLGQMVKQIVSSPRPQTHDER